MSNTKYVEIYFQKQSNFFLYKMYFLLLGRLNHVKLISLSSQHLLFWLSLTYVILSPSRGTKYTLLACNI